MQLAATAHFLFKWLNVPAVPMTGWWAGPRKSTPSKRAARLETAFGEVNTITRHRGVMRVRQPICSPGFATRPKTHCANSHITLRAAFHCIAARNGLKQQSVQAHVNAPSYWKVLSKD